VEICVPESKLEDARRALLNFPNIYKPVKALNRYDPTMRRHTFPWFKQSGVHLFFMLIPDSALSFSCVPTNVEQSPKPPHIPYPKAGRWAEALIDLSKTKSEGAVDLDDMVDGLAATEEWGRDNLKGGYLERFNKSVRGTKGRMIGKYSEDEYITRFRRRKKEKIDEESTPLQGTQSESSPSSCKLI
jgi:hypothetical protein